MLSKSPKAIFFSRNLFFLTVLFFSLNYNIARSEDSLKVKVSIGNDFISDSKKFWQDGLSYFSMPSRFNGKDWIYTVIGGGVTIGLMTIDADVKKSASVNNGSSQTGFWAFARSYGEAKYWGAFSVFTYSAGLFARNKELRIVGRMLIQSLVYAGILTSAVKFISGRTRPYKTNDQFQFNGFETNNDYLSFPSGHATVAFVVSSVLAERINTWWARVGLYTFASLSAYSRIHDSQHWLSDVFVGSIIGFGTGYFVVHQESEREKKHTTVLSKMNFYPSLHSVNLVYKF